MKVWLSALFLPLLLLAKGPRPAAPPDDVLPILPAGHNVLVILADDLGIDALERYLGDPIVPGDATVPVMLTPAIDEIMDKGIRFTNAWSTPLCSPTRATIQTGRFGFRTGIGWVIENLGQTGYSLPDTEITLPQLVAEHTPSWLSYTSAAFGKWHLEEVGGSPCAPVDAHSYDLFDGSPRAVAPASTLCNWQETICNPGLITQTSTEYMPERIVDAAIDWIAGVPSGTNWLCYLAPQSPYELPHRPPDDLQSQIPGDDTCGACESGVRVCYEAALQALDTKIGELLDTLGPNWWTKATVIFVGDNGTPAGASFFPMGKQKGTLFEGGMHVPFVIAGRAVHPDRFGDESSELVTTTDIYRTAGKLMGVNFPAGAGEDSVNLRPLLKKTPGTLARDIIYAERFNPNPTRVDLDEVAVRNDTYKLVWDCLADEGLRMHNLITDPDEPNSANLLLGGIPAPGTPERMAYDELTAKICEVRGDCACPQDG
ncbi:MAG: sulfatase-like hydrolase/transferase [Planctomycetota bacterium]